MLRLRVHCSVERLDPSTFHYSHRCSYQLLQSLLSPSGVNLFERLFRHYEEQKSPTTTTSSSSFTPPNSGHTALILRCLRDHAATFENYLSSLPATENEANGLDKRWQAVLEHLTEEEKKWAAMHLQERHNTDTFRISSGLMSNLNDSTEANKRREKFQSRYGTNDPPYLDDDDEVSLSASLSSTLRLLLLLLKDEAERLDIDDELMNNEQTSNERKVAEMKKVTVRGRALSHFHSDSSRFACRSPSSRRFPRCSTNKRCGISRRRTSPSR